MAIDTSIYGMIQSPKVKSPQEFKRDTLTLRNLGMENQYRQQQINTARALEQQRVEGLQRQKSFNEALGRNASKQELYSIDSKLAGDYDETQSKIAKEQAQQKDFELATKVKEADMHLKTATALSNIAQSGLAGPLAASRAIHKALDNKWIGDKEADELFALPWDQQKKALEFYANAGIEASKQHENTLKQLAEQRAALKFEWEQEDRPLEVAKKTNEVITGTPDPVTKLTPSQQAQHGPKPGVDIPLPPEVEAQRIRIGTKTKGASTGASSGGAGSSDPLVKAVLADPTIYDTLTPTAKTRIAPALQQAGFSAFGKPMTGGDLGKMAETQSAIKSLEDLRQTLKDNEQYIGPVAGFSALNPYSEARKAQAKIDLVKQRVGKALEGGVLRKEDEEKYKKILSTLNDTPELAISKVDGVIETLKNDLEIFKQTQRQGGRRVEGSSAKVPQSSASGGMVKMQAPNGTIKEVPAADVDHYLKIGARKVQ